MACPNFKKSLKMAFGPLGFKYGIKISWKVSMEVVQGITSNESSSLFLI
jgi:hypothetical protein